MFRGKAFSILEIVAVLAVISILSTLAIVTYSSVSEQSKMLVAKNNLTTTQLESRKVLAEHAIESGEIQFPEDIGQKLDVTDMTFTSGNSTDPSVVSVFLYSPTILGLTARAGEDCFILIDKLNSTKNWGVRYNSVTCAPSDFTVVVDNIMGSSDNPTVVL